MGVENQNEGGWLFRVEFIFFEACDRLHLVSDVLKTHLNAFFLGLLWGMKVDVSRVTITMGNSNMCICTCTFAWRLPISTSHLSKKVVQTSSHFIEQVNGMCRRYIWFGKIQRTKQRSVCNFPSPQFPLKKSLSLLIYFWFCFLPSIAYHKRRNRLSIDFGTFKAERDKGASRIRKTG